jgi:signal transduction histidine kinase
MPEGGQVKIVAQADERQVLVTVMDTGPGVSAARVAQLFDPFFTTKSHGTGLGLAVTRQIVKAHGAELSYRQNEPHGAVFELCFSRADAISDPRLNADPLELTGVDEDE